MTVDKAKLKALIAECRYGVSGKGPAIEVANDLLVDCCDNLESMIAENERIRGLLAEKVVDSTMLTGIIPEDGGMTIGLEGGACALMANAFGEQLYTSQAVNYIESTFSSGKYPDLGEITVTVKRETGKTPHQLRTAAEKDRDQLKAENEQLRKDAELHQKAQRAAGELPYGWQILICIEKDAGYAELIDPEGNEVDYASNHEYLADSVSDAIDEALSIEKNG